MRTHRTRYGIRAALCVALGMAGAFGSGCDRSKDDLVDTGSPMLTASVFPGHMARHALRDTRATATFAPDRSPAAEPYEAPRGGQELAALYPRAAPAVVLLLAADGASGGTGFLVGEDGWILTNHHVVNHASVTDDLRRQVAVFLGDLGEFGQMKPRKERLVAEVYKWDADRDLALLKLQEPVAAEGVEPEKRSFLNVAADGVRIGEDVATIGHRGIGLMWGMKPGNVIAIGRQLDNIGLMQMWENRARQAVRMLAEVAYEDIEKEAHASMRQFRNVMLIESTCATAPGDSGGPLLNMKGDVAGIVSFGRSDDSGVSASYFIHGSEIVDFLAEKPTVPLATLPVFWDAEPLQAELLDAIGNHKPDTLVFYSVVIGPDGEPAPAVIAQAWDLDGKSVPGMITSLEELFEQRAFDMEVYMVRVSDTTIMAYDLDNDGRFETVRMQRNSLPGVTELRLNEDGTREIRPVESGALLPLPPERLPAAWRKAYSATVLAKSPPANPVSASAGGCTAAHR